MEVWFKINNRLAVKKRFKTFFLKIINLKAQPEKLLLGELLDGQCKNRHLQNQNP